MFLTKLVSFDSQYKASFNTPRKKKNNDLIQEVFIYFKSGKFPQTEASV